jgi:ribosomal protection tetracycline resistance protein
MAVLTLGILAHVDAGKTTLTERILFETGVIPALGSVEQGTTQTDTLALERTRGITIRAAVAAFRLGALDVQLIDTPGHADFIAEVERSLDVLDAVVLVVSAVEGVQPQTVKLARAVRAAGKPLIVFINKIDRMGARPHVVGADVHRRLGLRAVAMSRAIDPGEAHASMTPIDWADPEWRSELIDLLAETDDAVIDEFDRSSGNLSDAFLASELRTQIGKRDIVPVYEGSARNGAGVAELLAGIERWLVPPDRHDDAPLGARLFKIARGNRTEKLVYARIEAGALAPRQRVTLYRRSGLGEVLESEERITAIDRFTGGTAVPVNVGHAGEIVLLHGLRSARIGDWIGDAPREGATMDRSCPAPPFESLVSPVDPAQANALHAALEQLAEQDPLISLRSTGEGMSVSLFGEVQKEVLAELLAQDYGVGASFGPSQIVCIERVAGTGEAIEIIGAPENPYAAGMGVRVEAGPVGAGIRYERELGALPPAWYRVIEAGVFDWLMQGLHGWMVTDCVVTLHSLHYWSPVSVAGDFRRLLPLPLFAALRDAQTVVCEPIEELTIELPVDEIGAVVNVLTKSRATVGDITGAAEMRRLTCVIPTAELRAVEQQLPRLTRGQGSWSALPAGYRPVEGVPPDRPRYGPNPLLRDGYLGDVARM